MNPMFPALAAILVMVIWPGAGGAQSTAPREEPAYVVTYLDLIPMSRGQSTTLLQQYRDLRRKQDGNVGVEILQDSGRSGRFAVYEVWKNQAALDAANSGDLKGNFGSVQLAPPDRRVHTGFSIASAPARAGLYVLTHVDVTPPSLPALEPLLRQLAEASRNQGAIAFDVLQQASRKNHFTVVEVWKDRKAFDSHSSSQPARNFREKLAPMLGALYDQRLYTLCRSLRAGARLGCT